jgi:hypothetical protein
MSSNRLYRYIDTYNVNSKVTLNKHFGNTKRGCPNTTRSLNGNNSTPLLIHHQNIRGLQNKTDELSMLWSTNFTFVLCFTEHHLCNDELNCIYTGCNRRNGPDIGRVFLMLNYTEKTPLKKTPHYAHSCSQPFPNPPTHSIQSPCNIQSAALTMQLTTMHSPAANCFPIPPHIPSNHPVTFSQQHSQCSSPLCTLLQPNASQFPTHPTQTPNNIQSAALTMQLPTVHSPTANSFPNRTHISFNHPVAFSQKHSPCSSPLCTLMQPTVSQSPTHPIKSPSYI